ncbi:MAG: tetratricopeptide repeat protein [Proteobacteria bacterium]|nr:tetratricopeptide repeat protein [Pseudomonadota bacterium]
MASGIEKADPEFIGSKQCTSCHTQEYKDWRGSHHDLAMQLANPNTVLGDFDNTTFTYNGITSTFYKESDKYFVRTDGEDGKLTNFPVDYVFGVYPLQQVLLPLSRGRWQALSIAWDARPKAEGGQRWYHLYPDETVDYKDPLHWTGPYQNWNTRCAECHSTKLEKNYNSVSKSFTTSFTEIDVSCEACHGPGKTHLELATAKKLDESDHGGFPMSLAQRGQWQFTEESDIASRVSKLESRTQIDSCGRCHSRRGTLGDYHYGADLLDTHRLSMPQSPLYYHDGQIRDEDYVYGSFIQSKMHLAGVVCSNCHEPHSLKLRDSASQNGVCAQCHKPAAYDLPQHHHHIPGSTGAQCSNCHMPETTYMGVDPRRDHSLRIPRPDLSIVMGTPNACNQCHTDREPQWALDALRQWGTTFRDTGTHPARAFYRVEQGDDRALPSLAQLAADTSAAPVWRANAMEALGQVGGRDALQSATMLLYSDDSIIRTSTVRGLEFLPLNQRYQLLQPLIDDEITSVRMEVAMSLAGVPLDQISADQAVQLQKLFREYINIQIQHADMPGVQLQLGIFYVTRGDLPSAEAAYREAIRLNPQLIPALLNLADLLRQQNREDEARELLLKALEVAPDHGAVLHALGLLETRSGQTEKALHYLGRAAVLESVGTRHRFIYAIALHDLGKPQEAIAQLLALLRTAPHNEEVLLALANYSAELGQRDKARAYAKTLTEISPGNRNYQQLYQQLSSG